MYLDDIKDNYVALNRINDPKKRFVTEEELLKSLDN